MTVRRFRLMMSSLAVALMGCRCQPCTPGQLVEAQCCGQTVPLVTGRLSRLDVRVNRGECQGDRNHEPTDVVAPVITAIAPSGARYPGALGPQGLEKGIDRGPIDGEFIVHAEVVFEEPGRHDVVLEFAGGITRTLWTYVAQSRAGKPVAVFDGVSCGSMRWTASGTAVCVAIENLDGGFSDSSYAPRSTLIRDNAILHVFGVGSWVFASPNALWKMDSTGGIERYADTDSGVPSLSPGRGASVPGATIGVAAFDTHVWVVRPDGLHFVAPNDAGDELRVVASRFFDAGFTIEPGSGVVAAGTVAYVLNRVATYKTRVCGFQLRGDESAIDEIADSCLDMGALSAVSARDVWFGTGGLQLLQIVDGGLQEIHNLATPWSWPGGGRFSDHPTAFGFDPVLIPRKYDGGLKVDAYRAYRIDGGIDDYARPAGATDRYVWLSTWAGRKLTILYDRNEP